MSDLAEVSQLRVGAAEADPYFCRQVSQWTMVLEVLLVEPEPALLCQQGMGMAMHGCARSGSLGRTSNRCGLTPVSQLKNLLRQRIEGSTAFRSPHVR